MSLTCLFAISGRAQTVIPNGGFEHWSHDTAIVYTQDSRDTVSIINPDFWTGCESPSLDDTLTPVYRSPDAHTGLYALGGRIYIYHDTARSLHLQNEYGPNTVRTTGQYEFPIVGRPTSFEGWYKLNSVGNDFLMIILAVGNNNNYQTVATFIDSTTKSAYTHFSVPVSINGGDSGIIGIYLLNSEYISNEGGIGNSNVHLGTQFVLDDLGLTGSDAVEQTGNVHIGFTPNYPNPFDKTTMLHYSLAKDDNVELEIFNMLGDCVAVLEDGYKLKGDHQVFFNAEHLSSGPYVCRLISTSQGVSSQTIQISH
jgi:hypothetical protein